MGATPIGRMVVLVTAASLLGGCGGRLLVYDADKQPVIGVPVRMAETS